jgi:5-methylcytosine-specific restriction endonuclease McrA
MNTCLILIFFGVPLAILIYGIVNSYKADKEEKEDAWKLGRHSTYSRTTNSNQYPLDWDELRRRVYERDNHTCSNCGRSGVALHAHHIVPLSRGGSNSINNLKTLCEDCHKLIHPHMS